MHARHRRLSWRAAWARGQAAWDAAEWAEAARWLDRARRLSPDDPSVALACGAALLRAGETARGVAVLEPLERRWGSPEAALALADALGDTAALARALQGRVVDPAMRAVADAVVRRSGAAGWCGMAGGRVVRGRRGRGRQEAPIGSPLDVARFGRVEGCVGEEDGGLAGWAWLPADPGRDPALTIRGTALSALVTMREAADGVPGLGPAARPRRVRLAAAECAALGWPLRVCGADGRELPGSPVWPVRPLPAVQGPARPGSVRGVAVVVPVHGGAALATACLRSVLATVPAEVEVHVVDDGSAAPFVPPPGVVLHRHERALGFPAAANRGIAAAGSRDVVLLNSDTAVPPGWLERLRAAAYSGSTVATATPLSNEGSIVSVPDRAGGNPIDPAMDGVAQAVNSRLVADIPVGVGFCLYLRRDCLEQVGALREDVFAQGYGEEVDLCLRARAAGWRHVAALDTVVDHVGGGSFGAAGTALRRRGDAVLARLHPGFAALVAAHEAADPLFGARRRIDAARFEGVPIALLVTHGAGGGVAELVASRRAALLAAGLRPVVLVPADGGCAVEGWPNLRYRLPEELEELAALLGRARPAVMEVHHMLGHDRSLLRLVERLAVPVEHWVHDDAAFCPRIALVDGRGRYCGEPDIEGCERCIAAHGSRLAEAIGVRALVRRSAAEFRAAARVVVPTADGARRLRRHFPAVRPEVVAWEAAAIGLTAAPAPGAVRVCVVGGIGVEKGFDVLLACAADARARGLPLEFVVVGHTADDERLLAAGPVFVTGKYAPEEAAGLIRAQRAALAFLPSIWPEVWCFALSRAWEAGLPTVAFDLGAQAERIRAAGHGALLPLGLPAPAVNDALLRLAARERAMLSSPACPS